MFQVFRKKHTCCQSQKQSSKSKSNAVHHAKQQSLQATRQPLVNLAWSQYIIRSTWLHFSSCAIQYHSVDHAWAHGFVQVGAATAVSACPPVAGDQTSCGGLVRSSPPHEAYRRDGRVLPRPREPEGRARWPLMGRAGFGSQGHACASAMLPRGFLARPGSNQFGFGLNTICTPRRTVYIQISACRLLRAHKSKSCIWCFTSCTTSIF